MDPLLWLVLAALVAGLLLAIPLIQRAFSRNEDPANKENGDGGRGRHSHGSSGVGGAPRRSRNVRSRLVAMQRARQAAAIPEEEGEEEDRESEEEEEEEDEMDEFLKDHKLPGKVGTKKLRKLQEKAEKKARREQEEAMREDRKKREALQEEERKRDEKMEKIRKQAEEEELRQQKEEQERREHEEYLQLREGFTVEEEGEEPQDDQDQAAKSVTEFIDYIKKTKVVLMEDVAAEFNMRTQDAISRIQSLQESGALTGVIDDRGKFIFISSEELGAVAAFIRQRGRVSIAELVSSSNTLVNLQPEHNHSSSSSSTVPA